MNLDKLKESARKYEQNSQWRQAIDVYKKALREFEESGEAVPDPSLYNRIGDLEMRNNDSAAAMRAYEQASDVYTEQGFFNNAIALCGKILRINPARTSTYLRLAHLYARKNFVGESKKNLVAYLERMDVLKHHDEAVAAIRVFADQFSGNPDIRLMLVDLLREGRSTGGGESSRAHLEKLAAELQGTDEGADGLLALDAETDQPPSTGAGDLVFLDLGAPGAAAAGPADADTGRVDGLDVGRSEVEEAWRRDSATVDGLEFIRSVAGPADAPLESDELLTESAFPDPDEGVVVDDADPIDIDAFPRVAHDDGVLPLDPGADEAFVVPVELPAIEEPGPPAAPDLVFLPIEPAAKQSVDDDLATVARDRGRVLIEIGDRAGGIAALEEAVLRFEETGRWRDALQTAEDLIRLEPDAIFRHQKRVELAYRSNDRDAMLQSYLGLAEALLRGGGVEHAITVYRRVLDHDPDNQKARASLAQLTRPEPAAPPEAPNPPPAPAESFVDLGSLILDEPQNRDTRIRVDQAAPIEDEDQAFHEALAQFKRGIDENIDAEDFQAHYDLGIAFKEMGLLDEAIAQFQKALRSPEGRLKTSEQLGIAFYEKSRFGISEAVLRRAIDSLPGGDEEKIGLVYWLGRALEAQRRADEALRYYERALAVDIRFLDVGDRVHRLTAGPA